MCFAAEHLTTVCVTKFNQFGPFFSSSPSPPPSTLSRADRLLRTTSERLARVRVRIDKKPMGRIKKKKSIIISKHSQSG